MGKWGIGKGLRILKNRWRIVFAGCCGREELGGGTGTGEVAPRRRTEEHGGGWREGETRSRGRDAEQVRKQDGWPMRDRESVLVGGTGWPGMRWHDWCPLSR